MNQGFLVFTICHQNAQDYGTTDDMSVSRVYFDLVVRANQERKTPPKVFAGLYSDVKLSAGANYQGGPLEVSYPKEIHGIIGYTAFAPLVEAYIYESFGSSGAAIGFDKATMLKMRDNIDIRPKVVPVELSEPEQKGW